MVQLQFINYLINTGDSSLLLLNNIDKTYFDEYPNEFDFIKSHLDTYNKIPDRETFISKFPNFDVIVVNETADYLIDELFKDKLMKLLAKKYNEMRQAAINRDVAKAVDIATNTEELAIKSKHLDSIDILKDTTRYNDYVERCSDFTKYYVKTGFPELDEIIGGWDRQEELATIAARPGVGKSWILLKSAIAAADQGLRVGIYSGEMSERKVGYRIDTLISHISNSGITKGYIGFQNDYKRYIDSLPTKFKDGTIIKVITPAMIGGPAGVTALRAFVEKENLDILFVDQHSLLEDDRHAKDPVTKAANISRDLKNLQVMKHIPIIAVSQQNRAGTENGIDVSHIAQADRIGQDSTVVIFLEQKDGILKVTLAKSRDSASMKSIEYAIDLDKGVFQYIPTEDNALDGKGTQELIQEFETDKQVF